MKVPLTTSTEMKEAEKFPLNISDFTITNLIEVANDDNMDKNNNPKRSDRYMCKSWRVKYPKI